MEDTKSAIMKWKKWTCPWVPGCLSKASTGNIQFWFISWQICTLDGVLPNFTYQKNHEKIRETLFTIKLQSAASFHFTNFFIILKIMKKFVRLCLQLSAEFLSISRIFSWFFTYQKTLWKNSWNYIYILAIVQNPFQFHEIFYKKFQTPYLNF